MKTLTANEAQMIIIDFLDQFKKIAEFKAARLTASIEDVSFADLIILYHRLPADKRQIYLPGEMDTETMMIIYVPAPGCTISIESESCIKGTSKKKVIMTNDGEQIFFRFKQYALMNMN